jgi:hypothetical protein
MFVISLIGLVGLFGLKQWEARNGRTVAPEFREKLDAWALHFKDLLLALRVDIEKVPPELLHFARSVLHEVVLLVGWAFHFLAQQAHRLADLVSHKRNFIRRAPRSEFLTKIMRHKEGEDQGGAS